MCGLLVIFIINLFVELFYMCPNISTSGFLKNRKRIYAMWENRSQVGFNYSLSYSQVDQNYSPGLGFELRSDFKSTGDGFPMDGSPPKVNPFGT